jgi:Cof subfamily protein (haloacid dehalogenase superfamily)
MTAPIICFDLDGTLLDKNEKIHPKDIEILKTRRDVVFIPCTGRPLDSVMAMFHHNGLFLDGPMPFPAITQNGSAIHKPGGEIHTYHSFSKDVQNELLDTFELFPHGTFMLMEKTRNLLVHPSDYSIHWMGRFSTPWEPYDETCRDRIFGKATCIADNRQMFDDLTAQIKHIPLEIGISMSTIFDINPEGISKRTGVIGLLGYLKIKDATIYAAGDGENDLDLFTLANLSFSPATSPEHVKEQTDRIVDTSQHGLFETMLEVAGCI